MKSTISHTRAEHEFFMELAKARANALRDEAINNLVDGAAEVARRAARSAIRFARSLLRHKKLRAEPGMG